MRKTSLLFTFMLTVLAYTLNAQLVTSVSELNSAISAAVPGTTITLENGTWTDVQIDINAVGTESNPITIQAETMGSVIFEGNSYVEMGGEYIIFDGVIFQNPSGISTSTPIIEFESSDECDHCTLSNVKIDSYNGTESQSTEIYKWVLLHGQYNEIKYCSFVGKWGVGSIINDNRNSSDPDYTKIHHNYFGSRSPVGEVNELNNQDAIRIGNSSTSLYSSYTEVYNNFFYDFHGEVEVISNKSCNNKYYNNTFKNYNGSLTLRHGDDCEVYNNYFLADNNTFTAGVRVMGENHKIYNNYIADINSKKSSGSTSGATGGINVTNGKENSALNEYYQVKNTTIINNTFVNCDYAIRVGTQVKSTLDQEPVDLIVANNIMYNTSTSALQEVTAPSGVSIYEGNITQDGSWDLTNGTNDNQLVSSGLMESGVDMYVLSDGSAAIDAGVGTYSYLTEDILGGLRTTDFDAGAEEYGAGGGSGPYTIDDVELTVGFGANVGYYLQASDASLRFVKAGEVLIFKVLANVEWTISEDADWLSLNFDRGIETTTIEATASENTSGVDRTATITLTEDGGENLTYTISVIQSGGLTSEDVEEIEVVEVIGVGTQEGTHIADNTINDVLTDRWSGESVDGSAYLTFDLSCVHTLTSMDIYFYAGDERNTYYKILTSEDNVTYTNTIGSDVDTSTILTGYETIVIDFVDARYIRIEGYGNSEGSGWNSIVEVKFFGDPSCVTTSEEEAPVVTSSHNNQSISSDSNCEAELPDYTGDVTIEGDINDVEVTQSPVVGTMLTGSNNIVELTITNSLDKTTKVNFYFSVVDETVPVVTSEHLDVELEGDEVGDVLLPDYTTLLTATDNCDDSFTIDQSPSPSTLISGEENEITLTVTDDSDNATSITFNVSVSVTSVGVATYNSDNELLVYPNPTSDILTIEGENIKTVKILELTGKTVYFKSNYSDSKLTLDVANYSKGIYLLEVSTETGRYSQRLIIR